MNKSSTLFFLSIVIISVCILGNNVTAQAQAQYQSYSFSFYQKLSRVQYTTDTRQHTALKPYIVDSTMRPLYDSLMDFSGRSSAAWANRALSNKHLFEVENGAHTFYADLLPDWQIGRDFSRGGKTIWNTGIGIQLGGKQGDRFHYQVSGYVNRAVLPDYINQFVDRTGVIPGQGFGDPFEHKQSWSNMAATLSFTPVKYVNIALAYDKNFIGDGYRSMLLSDVANNYTSFKVTGNLGNVQYLSMWSYMIDPLAPKLPGDDTNRAKWGAFQYLDWNVNNRLSLGFFQSILWANKTEDGTRGFDPSYLNPIIFLRPIESATPSSPDKAHLGLNVKYKLLGNLTAYGQFLLSEFTAKEFFSNKGYIHNKWGAQLGLRGFDIFKVANLNALGEVNFARPYTYSHKDPITSYGHFSQPLAHPLGANFVEVVGILNYTYQRFDFSLQGNYARYGLDPTSGQNFGKNIFLSYNTYEHRYGNHIGQGLATDLFYADARVSYSINPKYNLRIEAGAIVRQESNEVGRISSGLLSLGLRSSFRDLYRDF